MKFSHEQQKETEITTNRAQRTHLSLIGKVNRKPAALVFEHNILRGLYALA